MTFDFDFDPDPDPELDKKKDLFFSEGFPNAPVTRSDPAMMGPAEEEIMNLLAARIQGIRDQVKRFTAL